jgi:formylglycine-generating enzyme required for sulfatase activity
VGESRTGHRRTCLPLGQRGARRDTGSFNNGRGGPSAVGSYPSGASPYGALDMAGNVWEWVNDWFGNYGATSSDRNPQGLVTGTSKVVRGGAWPGSQVCAAGRVGFYPDESRKACATCNNWGPEPPICSCSRQDNIGFRCAASPGGSASELLESVMHFRP